MTVVVSLVRLVDRRSSAIVIAEVQAETAEIKIHRSIAGSPTLALSLGKEEEEEKPRIVLFGREQTPRERKRANEDDCV